MSEELIIRKSLEIKAPLEKVWDALTNPGMTQQYMYCEVQSSWNVGSPIMWKGYHDGKQVVFVKGKITAINPPKRLQFTLFDPNKGIADIPENYVLVTYNLHALNDGTVFSITQGDYAMIEKGKAIYEETVKGWDFTLPVLKKFLEGKRWEMTA